MHSTADLSDTRTVLEVHPRYTFVPCEFGEHGHTFKYTDTVTYTHGMNAQFNLSHVYKSRVQRPTGAACCMHMPFKGMPCQVARGSSLSSSVKLT